MLLACLFTTLYLWVLGSKGDVFVEVVLSPPESQELRYLPIPGIQRVNIQRKRSRLILRRR